MLRRPEDFARHWIDTWNSRDLERILSLYDDAAELVAARVVKLGFDPAGRVVGKRALRAYLSAALESVPNLHLKLLGLFESPDSVVLQYANDRNNTVCEYVRLSVEGKIVHSAAHYSTT